ncbi:MAG: hypothetical protein ACOX3U_02340 [Christensenellales bacterium]|jgi:hypothetical protein
MRKYYSPLKSYHRIKRPRIFYKFANLFLKIIIGKSKVIWLTQISKEPAVFICNHTRLWAPLSMEFNFNIKVRPWVNGYMLTYRNTIKLFYHKIAYDLRPGFLRKILLIIFAPLINLYFRGLNSIPVFHDMRIRHAFKKTTETLESGMSVVIYPEKNIPPPYKYVNELEKGFVHLAKHYYESTGKCVTFYPVYCSRDLKTIMVGEGVIYNPEIDIKSQRNDIAAYLVNQINKMGGSLPEHKIYMNKVYPPDINKFNF